MKPCMIRNDGAVVVDVAAIGALHDGALATPGWPDRGGPEVGDAFLQKVLENHCFNSLLWNEEDQARRTDVPDSAIAANKRAIDRYNQARNDAIEALDDLILETVAQEGSVLSDDAWVNSETAGSLIDRLSIGSLKIHHMGLQTEREDVDEPHRATCRAKLATLKAQRSHLTGCLHELIAGMLAGRCTYRAHRQFKMYNDATLNPCLYRAPDTAAPER